MPRVTDAYRRARRDEIAAAALRCLARRGVANTSIADIVAESGLSAGAIYSHFENKAQLARYIAASLLGWRIDRIRNLAEDGTVRTPTEVMAPLLGAFEEEGLLAEVVLQFWGEAASDAELLDAMSEEIDALRGAFARAVLPWARLRTDEAAAPGAAARAARAMLAVCQGYIVGRALFGARPPGDYLRDCAALFT